MAKKTVQSAVRVRPGAREDAGHIAQLSTELGYPSSREQVERRWDQIVGDPDQVVYVAAQPNGEVLGWIHVRVSRLIESDPEAEIGGLVVDGKCRRSGLGTLLIERAEQWAREKGLGSVYLRSNIVRADAHAFYQRLGYRLLKTQHAFRKSL